MGEIRSYHDLEVWQMGRTLVQVVYKFTASFPTHELYGLTNQMRRAAISIPSNIAEGYSRKGLRDYIQFVVTAIGSLAENWTPNSFLLKIYATLRPQQQRTFEKTSLHCKKNFTGCAMRLKQKLQ